MSWALETIRALEPHVRKGLTEKEFDALMSFSEDRDGKAELKRLYFALVNRKGWAR